MLPFLKDRHEGSASAPVDESIKREPDNEEDYGMVDAIADDMIEALQKKDKSLLKDALNALIEHIRYEDELQDSETI